jgi:hypothetical protein
MNKKTIFAVSFFLIMLVVVFMYVHESPVPGGSRFHLPEPRDVEVGGINFTVSWGFIEDEEPLENEIANVSNHQVLKSQRTFHQNDILLLSIAVCEFNENLSLDDLNDGSWQYKSINGVDGIFKNESVTTSTGVIKNTHPRYYFDYMKNGKLVMIECDKLSIIEEIVS